MIIKSLNVQNQLTNKQNKQTKNNQNENKTNRKPRLLKTARAEDKAMNKETKADSLE